MKIMAMKGLQSSVTKMPDGIVCYSNSIRPFLTYLNDWRSKKGYDQADLLSRKMNKVNERVLRKIFKLPEDKGLSSGERDLEVIQDSKDEEEDESRLQTRQDCSGRERAADDSIFIDNAADSIEVEKDETSIVE